MSTGLCLCEDLLVKKEAEDAFLAEQEALHNHIDYCCCKWSSPRRSVLLDMLSQGCIISPFMIVMLLSYCHYSAYFLICKHHTIQMGMSRRKDLALWCVRSALLLICLLLSAGCMSLTAM
jgi:hypothetical protein